MIYVTPLFPTWKHVWSEHDQKFTLSIERLESLLAKRNRTLPMQSKGDLTSYVTDLKKFTVLYDEGQPDDHLGPREDRRRLLAILRRLVPLIRAGMWVRWLDIEKGLSLTLQQENLLGTALLARTLAEESLRAIELSRDCNQLLGHDTNERIKSEDLYKIADRFHTWALPRTRQRTLDQVKQKAASVSIDSIDSEIDEARAKLNDYVHPNYGSHRAAYDPTETNAAITVIDAVTTIYDRYFLEPWLEPRSAKKGRPGASLSAITDNLLAEGIESVVIGAKRYHDINSDALESGAKRLLETRNDTKTEIVVSLYNDKNLDLTPTKTLCESLGKRWPARLTEEFIIQLPFPINSSETLLLWNGVVTAISQLDQHANDATVEQRVLSGIESLYAITALKENILIQTLPLLLMQGLVVSCSVLVRSLLEHHAVAVWVKDRVNKQVESVLKNGKKCEINQIEEVLSRALVGTKSTAEPISSIKDAWEQSFGQLAINLVTTVQRLDQPLQFEYDLLSQTIHGYTMTGCDMMGAGGEEVVSHGLARDLSVIGMLSNDDTAVSRAPFLSYLRFGEIAKQVRQGTQLSEAVKQVAMPQKLKRGRDYSGDGSQDSPHKFRDGLVYWDAFYKYCDDHSITPDRQAWEYKDYFGDELLRKREPSIFFVRCRREINKNYPHDSELR